MSKGKKYSQEFDAQFEAFLNESLSTCSDVSLDTGRLSKILDGSHNVSKFSAIQDDDEIESVTDELDWNQTRNRFLKKPIISEVAEPPKPSPRSVQQLIVPEPVKEMDSSINSFLGDESLANGDMSILDEGKDTLEELEDKKRFFQKLEKEVNRTPDYGKLNKELDQSEALDTSAAPGDTTIDNLINNGDVKMNNDNTNNQRNMPKGKSAEGNVNGEANMLSQVALLDSLDSTFDKKAATVGGGGGGVRIVGVSGGGVISDDMQTITEGTAEQQSGSSGASTRSGASVLRRDTYVDAAPLRKNASSDTEHVSEAGELEASHAMSTRGNNKTSSAGFGNTDTHRDLEAMRNEMKKYGVTNQGSFDSTSALIQDTSGFEPGTLEPGVEAVSGMTSDTSQKPLRPTMREGLDDATGDRVKSERSTNQQPSVTLNDQSLGSNSSLGGTQNKSGFFKRPRNLPTGQKDGTLKRLRDKYSHVKGSGYNQRAPPSKISAAKSVSSPDGRNSYSKEQTSTDGRQSGFDERTIMESINSLTNFLSARFSSDSDPPFNSDQAAHKSSESPPLRRKPLMQSTLKGSDVREEVKYWQDMYHDEMRLREKLQNDAEEMESEFQRKQDALKSENDQILYKLKQENFVLSTKVEESRRRLLARAKDSGETSESQVTHLEEELRQQESLLAGYQTENERMFNELKNLQQASKGAEERLIKENLKLKGDLVRSREECNQKEVQLMSQTVEVTHNGGVGTAVLGSGRIAQLEAELKLAKTQEEMNRSSMTDMERRIEHLLRKNRDLEEELRLAKDCQSLESKGLEERYKKEMEELRKKLRWYGENQQLLDQDMEKLKSKEEEVKQLRKQLDENQTMTGRRKLEATNNRKDNSLNADAKKIQDLERQVKEMENILKKRDPNSLPVLMWAASNVPGGGEGSSKSPSVLYLESQIKKLQEELESKDEESKRSLRALEQKYNTMKLKYEERIFELEERVSHLARELEFKPPPHSNVSTVQKELEAVKEKHRKVCGDYEQEMNNLRAEVLAARGAKLGAGKTVGIGSRKQTEEREKLRFTVQRLEDEKSQLVTDLRMMTERLAKANVKLRLDGNGSTVKRNKSKSINDISKTDPLMTTLGGGGLSDVVIENGLLRRQIDDLHSELNKQKTNLQSLMVEFEQREQMLQEDTERKISELKSLHQSEVQRRLAGNAVESSSSKFSQLNNQISTQKIVIEHLQSQMALLSKAGDEVSALRQIQINLEAQLKKSNTDLLEARRSHTPQMRHFEQLQAKIGQMEERHKQREEQLQQLLHQNRLLAVQDVEAESSKWRRVLDSKHREIDRFRSELDSILNVLRELRRHGVVIPYRTDLEG